MSTTSKTYSDNSHVWMMDAADYADKLISMGFTFEDFEAQQPNLAASMWGQDVKFELQCLIEASIQEALEEPRVTTEPLENNGTVIKVNDIVYYVLIEVGKAVHTVDVRNNTDKTKMKPKGFRMELLVDNYRTKARLDYDLERLI